METIEDSNITTEELKVFKAMYKSDLKGSQDYKKFYSILPSYVRVYRFNRLVEAILDAYT
jgi:hypothetical protein